MHDIVIAVPVRTKMLQHSEKLDPQVDHHHQERTNFFDLSDIVMNESAFSGPSNRYSKFRLLRSSCGIPIRRFAHVTETVTGVLNTFLKHDF